MQARANFREIGADEQAAHELRVARKARSPGTLSTVRMCIQNLRALALLVSVAAAASAGAEPFWYARASRESVPLPTFYTNSLSEGVEPDPSAGAWRQRMDTLLDGPTHLQWRLCHGGAAEQDRFVAALRRATADGSLTPDVEARFVFTIGGGCGSGTRAERRPLCDWLRRVVRSEPAGPARAFLYGQFLSCAEPGDRALFEEAGAPDFAVIAFHREHGPLGYSERLGVALRRSAEELDRSAVRSAVDALSRVDDPRVANLLLALHAATSDPEMRRVLALGLSYQSDPSAFELYRREWRAQCEERNSAIAAGTGGGALIALGYVVVDTRCDARALERIPPPRPPAPLDETAIAYPSSVATRRAALASFALDERILCFSPDDAQAIGSHAPLMRRLVDLVSPDLDDLVLEEVWPALDQFAFDRGPVLGFAVIDRLGFNLGVRDERELAQVTEDLRSALAEPHFVDAYLDGSRLRFALRPLGRRFDVEAVVAALNQLLELRGSEQRLLLLAPTPGDTSHQVLAGPRARLLEAVHAGAATPATAASDDRAF